MKIKYLIKENLIKAGDYCFFRKKSGFSFSTFIIDQVKRNKVHFATDPPELWYSLGDVRKGDIDETNDNNRIK